MLRINYRYKLEPMIHSTTLVCVWLALGALFSSLAVADPMRQAAALDPDARRIVQESSQHIAELVRLRPAGRARDKGAAVIQQQLDGEIAAIQRERAGALKTVVLADNHGVQLADRERDIYRVVITDGQNRIRWLSGRIPAIWHLHQLDPAVFTLAESIRSRPQAAELPAETQIDTHLLVGGTSAQSLVHAFPGDIDYDETFVVQAPTPAAAGEAMAALFVELVERSALSPNLEFDALHLMVPPARRTVGSDYEWPRSRLLDPTQRQELARQFATLDGGRLNSDWRLLIPGGRYLVIGKIYGVHAINNTTGERLFATQPIGTAYQQVYFGANPAASSEQRTLGDFAAHRRKVTLQEIAIWQRLYERQARDQRSLCQVFADPCPTLFKLRRSAFRRPLRSGRRR